MNELPVRVTSDELRRIKANIRFKLPYMTIYENKLRLGEVHDYRYVRFQSPTKGRSYDFEGINTDYEVLVGDRKK